MKTNPWTKQTVRAAMFDLYLNMRVGMTGYLANFHSTRAKSPIVRRPKTIRQTTVADFQGKLTPPNSRPNRSMSVPPTIKRDPSQSMALRPAINGVLGVSMSRNTSSIIKHSPSSGRLM